MKSQLQHTKLFYGGGIENNFQVREMKEYADAVIVGNLIYDNIKQALKTVKAVHSNKE